MKNCETYIDLEKLNKRPLTLWFLRLFYGKHFTSNAEKRSSIGKFCGLVGIIFNTLLSAGKIFAGLLVHSLAILADGFNNLTDAGSSILTLIGFKLSEKPADKDHPFGHARYEYLASLFIAVIILFIGYELIKSSIQKIITPEVVNFSLVAIIVLSVSIIIKVLLAIYNFALSKIIFSDALKGTAIDNRNDAISTTIVLISLIINEFTPLNIDGYTGCAVAIFIIYSAFSLAKTTVSRLLGEGANKHLAEEIKQHVCSFDKILGCHDLLVHDYGPTKIYASIHVEMDKNIDSLECHEIIDEIERSCHKQFGINLVIHHDPIITDNPLSQQLSDRITETLKEKYNYTLLLHDFRVSENDNIIRLNFDMALPRKYRNKEEEITNLIQEDLTNFTNKKTIANITFDVDENE